MGRSGKKHIEYLWAFERCSYKWEEAVFVICFSYQCYPSSVLAERELCVEGFFSVQGIV